MIIWGGDGKTGGKYNPDTDTWSDMSLELFPSGSNHKAVWTGSEMIVWGGTSFDGTTLSYLNTGAKYNPSTDTWTPFSSDTNASARAGHTMIWTGSEMIIWGGGKTGSNELVNTGAKLTP